MDIEGYHKPESLEEASRLLKELGPGAMVMAGTTDIVPRTRFGKLHPRYLVDIKRIHGLRDVDFDGAALTIGALATLNDLLENGTVKEHFPALTDVLSSIATQQVRNRATIGGNLCNAAPSADCAPILIAAGARVRIYGDEGGRVVPLRDLFTGPGTTVLEPGEILTHIEVDKPSPETRCAYVKHEIRETLEIAIVGVAVALTVSPDGVCQDARVVVGACAPTPVRSPGAEALLKGSGLSEEHIRKAGEAAAEDISPIDDVRGSAWYRREMTSVCLAQCISKALETGGTPGAGKDAGMGKEVGR